MSSADLFALIASAVFLARLLPQPVRLARRGVSAGVSSVAALNAVVSALAWTAYGLLAHLPVVWAVSILALVPSVWQVVLLRHATTRRDVAWAAAFVAALVAAAGLGLFDGALAFTVVVTAAPQLRQVFVDHDLSGLAPATWWVAIVDATTWGLYGYAIGDVALVGYFLVLATTAIVILARLAQVGRRQARTVAEPIPG